MRGALGGWQLSGILTLETGAPFSVFANGDPANTGASNERADRLADGNLPASQRTLLRWFDTAAFAQPQSYTYGNAGRNILRGDATKNFDAGIFKSFRLIEGQSLQFRAELFGATNTPHFANPNTTVKTSTFGFVTSASGSRVVQFGLKYVF